MKFIPLIALIVLASCAQEGRYPVSGEECGPNDPVLSMEPVECVPIPNAGV